MSQPLARSIESTIFSAPSRRYPSGEVVTYWDGPPPGGPVREGREAEFRRAERLMRVGIAHIRDEPWNYEVARRCFHAATCLYAWALGADRRLAFARDRLGYAHHRLGQDHEAESCYLQSLAIQDESRQQRTTWNEVTLLNLAVLYGCNGQQALNRAVLRGYDPTRPHVLPGMPVLDEPPPALAPPASRGRPKRGYSAHGLRMADVAAAFVQAERELGTDWRLSGRGHCERVVLDARYSRVVSPAIRSWVYISPQGAASRRILFPLKLVKRAAEILGTNLDVIMGREY